MKNPLIFTALLLCFAACKNETPKQTTATTEKVKTETAEEAFAKIDSFVKQYEQTPQTFIIPNNKPSVVKGAKATLVNINPNDLETISGAAVKGDITVELKELTTQSELLKNNAATMSDGKLLVSGGAYYIGMKANGEELKLKQGKKLNVAFSKTTKKEMALFIGQRDEKGNMNWKETQQKLISAPKQTTNRDTAWFTLDKPDTIKKVARRARENDEPVDSVLSYVNGKKMTDKEKQQDTAYKKAREITNQLYQTIAVERLGWLNCDNYTQQQMTTFKFLKPGNDGIAYYKVYVVFLSMNSMIASSSFENTFNMNVPLGEKVRVIAIGFGSTKIKTFKQDITIQAEQTIDINFKEPNTQEISSLFD